MRKSKATKEIIALVSETSEYSKAEIEDMYLHLVYHIHQQLLTNGQINLSGIGKLKVKQGFHRKFYSAALQKEFEVQYAPTVSIIADVRLKNALADKQEQDEINEVFKE
jgi:nucleoid DNA-binding protein